MSGSKVMPQYGCTVEYVGSNPSVDVVFVHGLRGHTRRTWTTSGPASAPGDRKGAFRTLSRLIDRNPKSVDAKKPSPSSIFWPTDLLAKDVADLRIITFGYDADISSLLSRTSDRSIFSVAQDLIVRLEMLRDSTSLGHLPIIFVAHSLGGIVVKDALKFSQDQEGFQEHLFSIFERTYGVIFFGTPHRGSEMASLGLTAARIAGIGIAESSHQLLRSLELGSPELQRISDSFSRMLPKQAKGLQVYSFSEGLPLTGLSIAGKVVEEYSSIIGDAYEGKATINANHMDMCRFSDRANPDYQLVVGVIRRWSRMMASSTPRPSKSLTIQRPGGESSRSEGPNSETLPPINLKSEVRFPLHLPQAPSRHFCGRDHELSEIDAIFHELKGTDTQRILAVYGLGGVGKTQLCLKYASSKASMYNAVFWINSSTERLIDASFRQVAQALVDWAARIRSEAVNFSRIGFDLGLSQFVSPTTGEVSHAQDQAAGLTKAVVNWLDRPENTDWLLIFDSADDLEGLNLQAYLPHSTNGDILISSRRPESAQLGRGMELKCLEPSAGMELLITQSNFQNEDTSHCQTISHLLGHLPLAIAQAASYMASTQTTPERYLDLYQTQRNILFRHKPPTTLWQYRETVFTTWEISYAAISKSHPRAARLLLLLAHMDPDNIFTTVFELGVKSALRRQHIWENFWPRPKNRMAKLRSALKLKSNGEVDDKSRKSTFRNITWLEALVSDPPGLPGALATLAAFSLITKNIADDGVSMHPLVKEWATQREQNDRADLAREFVVLVGRALDVPETLLSPESAPIILGVSRHVPCIIESIRYLEKNQPEIFDINLCHALEAIGGLLSFRYSTCSLADRLYVQEVAFGTASSILGLENRIVLILLGNLALTLEDCKSFDSAIQLATMRVNLSMKISGPLHYDTRDALADLGKAIHTQGTDLRHARQIYELCLQRHREATGHQRDGVSTMLNLAMLLSDLHELDEAHRLVEEAIPILRAQDRQHLLLDAYGFQSLILTDQGRIEEAMDALKNAVDTAEKNWGANSEQALVWRGHFLKHSSCYIPFNDKNTVDGMHREFEEWMAAVGDRILPIVDRPEVHFAQIGLYYDTGQNEKAIEASLDLLQRSNGTSVEAKKQRREVLNGLGMAYWDCGLLHEAIKAYDEAFELVDAPLNKEEIECNRAVAMRDLGQYNEAEEIFRAHIESTKPPDYASLDFTNYASILQAQGRCEEAMEMYENVVKDMEKQAGEPAAKLLTLHRKAELHAMMGDLDQAIQILEKVFESKINTLGICRPATLKTASTLETMLRKAGREAEADDISARVRPFLEYA